MREGEVRVRWRGEVGAIRDGEVRQVRGGEVCEVGEVMTNQSGKVGEVSVRQGK